LPSTSRAWRALAGSGVHQEAQGAVEILAGAQHDRQFAGEVGHLLPAQRRGAAELEQGEAGEPAARGVDAQRGGALVVQALHHRRLVGGLHGAARALAGTVQRAVAEARHQKKKARGSAPMGAKIGPERGI
jgi:hypothetical protein